MINVDLLDEEKAFENFNTLKNSFKNFKKQLPIIDENIVKVSL
jgi:hypothetical protein